MEKCDLKRCGNAAKGDPLLRHSAVRRVRTVLAGGCIPLAAPD